MICQAFYYSHSIEEPITHLPIESNHRKTYACKCIEFSRLIYLYTRHFLPKDEDIYIIDNASPISIKYLLDFINEPYEIMDVNSYQINPNVKIHVKSFKENLVNPWGVSRMNKEILKMSYLNNQDLVINECDSLIAHNFIDDCKGYNFVARTIGYQSRSCELYTTFIGKEILHFRDKFVRLDNFLDKLNEEQILVFIQFMYEGGFYKMFAFDKVKEMKQKDKHIHDCGWNELKNFILDNRLKHEFVDYYINQLDNKINNQ